MKAKANKGINLIKKIHSDEDGVALAIAIIIIAIMSVIAITALAFTSSEVRIAGADLRRTQTFYATSASMEKMTSDFSNLFRKKMRPTSADLIAIQNDPPPALLAENFTFLQTLNEDTVRLNQLRSVQGLSSTSYPRVNIPEGPFSGLYATIVPYKMTSTGTYTVTGAQVKLERDFNNYLVPIFQFGIFSNEDIEIHPGPQMTFNGRIHSNQNIYALRNTKFLNNMTMAGELVRHSNRGGTTNTASGWNNVFMEVNGINVQITKGSVQAGSGLVGGPNLSGTPGTRGYYPASPQGVANPSWETSSILPAVSGVPDQFGGEILTNTTGANTLKLPLQLQGGSTAELIKRSLPSDDQILSESRYHNKSQIRILIDDKTAGSGASNAAGIPAGRGVVLENTASGFSPIQLNGGRSLWRVGNTGSYIDTSDIRQELSSGNQDARTVRGIKSAGETVSGNYIPQGSGIEAKILIEIIRPDGTAIDVTREILSMGMTQGEPNGIVYLQRPLWAAYIQGSRDRSAQGADLANLTRNFREIADGEIEDPTPFFDASRGFISATPASLDEDGGSIRREYVPVGPYNQIVPINVYNVREGWFRSGMDEYNIYERGMTSVVEINMRNLARWFDGVYDTNLLSGTQAVSTNIKGDEGYTVYISDRRGDKVKAEYLSNGTSYLSTNGMVDNEDIYGPNSALDAGEDVIDFGWDLGGVSKGGTLQKDTTELPDTGTVWVPSAPLRTRADTIMSWNNPSNYFRRSIRLFDAETLSFSAAAGKLSPTKGITISTENIAYIWGSYNTTGVAAIPVGGSTLNDGGYSGPQVPSSIVCDAVSPLSKTWFDALSALYPEGSGNPRGMAGTDYRRADANLPDVTQATAVRAAIISGTTLSALDSSPGRDSSGMRRSGGIINFPRFLELWNLNGTTTPWSYTGSIIPLYRSTQAVAPWENDTSVIYMPPRRNWSFDTTFLDPNKLPPSTPFFQYVQSTGFRQSLQ